MAATSKPRTRRKLPEGFFELEVVMNRHNPENEGRKLPKRGNDE